MTEYPRVFYWIPWQEQNFGNGDYYRHSTAGWYWGNGQGDGRGDGYEYGWSRKYTIFDVREKDGETR